MTTAAGQPVARPPDSRIQGTAIMLIGPSTVGKTDIAIALAEQVGGEVVNADKFYLYRGFPSTTGLPDFSNCPGIRTHLFEILAPEAPCPSARAFASSVTTAIQTISSRGAIPIVEGCYHRFSHAILQSMHDHRWIVAGITWPAGTNVAALVAQRVHAIFHDRGGIDEVRTALENGHRRTYVMRKGSMVKPLVEYIDGDISLEMAKEKAIAEILASAYKALRKFLDFPTVAWYEHDQTRTATVRDSIARQLVVPQSKREFADTH